MNKEDGITEECREKLIDALAKELDTHDKRSMFLRCSFHTISRARMQLEGTAYDCAWNIYEEFRKHQMLGSLMACMNGNLGTDLYLETTDKKK